MKTHKSPVRASNSSSVSLGDLALRTGGVRSSFLRTLAKMLGELRPERLLANSDFHWWVSKLSSVSDGGIASFEGFSVPGEVGKLTEMKK